MIAPAAWLHTLITQAQAAAAEVPHDDRAGSVRVLAIEARQVGADEICACMRRVLAVLPHESDRQCVLDAVERALTEMRTNIRNGRQP